MNTARLVLCAAAFAILAPASALAQGVHQGPVLQLPMVGAAAPCWTSDHPVHCLRSKLDEDIAHHRVGPNRAAELSRRLRETERLDRQVRESVRQLDVDIPDPDEPRHH